MDGGVSVFDAKTRVTKELLDNATFVSNPISVKHLITHLSENTQL